MADTDKSLKVGIETDARRAISELDRYNAKLKGLHKEVDSGAAAVGRWTKSKQQFAAVLKGVQAQFPGLAAVARLALNPITISLALMATAARTVIKVLREAREGFTASAWGAEKVNKAAEAWKQYAEAIGQVQTGAETLKTTLADVEQRMSGIATISEKFGEGIGQHPLFQRRQKERAAAAQAEGGTNAKIEAERLRREADAIAPKATLMDERNTMKSLEADAKRAEEEISKLDKQIEELDAIGDEISPGEVPTVWANRLGIGDRARMGITDPRDFATALRGQRTEWQRAVDRRDAQLGLHEINAGKREAAAALRKKAAEFDQFGGDALSDARDLARSAQLDYGATLMGQGTYVPVTKSGGGVSIRPEIAQELREMHAEMMEFMRFTKVTYGSLRKDAEVEARRQAAKPE